MLHIASEFKFKTRETGIRRFTFHSNNFSKINIAQMESRVDSANAFKESHYWTNDIIENNTAITKAISYF